MVTIILGVLAAVAIPRYQETIEISAEASVEDAFSNIFCTSCLENYAIHKF